MTMVLRHLMLTHFSGDRALVVGRISYRVMRAVRVMNASWTDDQFCGRASPDLGAPSSKKFYVLVLLQPERYRGIDGV
jgi:hypothetical protein